MPARPAGCSGGGADQNTPEAAPGLLLLLLLLRRLLRKRPRFDMLGEGFAGGKDL